MRTQQNFTYIFLFFSSCVPQPHRRKLEARKCKFNKSENYKIVQTEKKLVTQTSGSKTLWRHQNNYYKIYIIMDKIWLTIH
jgi:hypothetical protein